MTAISWQQLLDAACTPDEVISACRDFVASIDHAEVARLPDACKPGKLVDTHDVASYAYELLKQRCADLDLEGAETVHRLSGFFSEAVARLSQLAAPPPAATQEMVKTLSS